MYKKDLALNNLQWLICHKNQVNSGHVVTNEIICYGVREKILKIFSYI